MATVADRTVRLSVLDRLQGAGESSESTSFAVSVQRYKAAVLRDLDWLLNTRRTSQPAPDYMPELQQSLYHYGLADVTSMSGDSNTVRRWLVRHVEEVIELFEPRLGEVRVVPVMKEENNVRSVRFSIEALLKMDPNPERVVFDTVLEVTSGTFKIRGRHA